MKKKILILTLAVAMVLALVPSMAMAAPRSRVMNDRFAFYGNVQTTWFQKLTHANGVAREIFSDPNYADTEPGILKVKGFSKALTGTVTLTSSKTLSVRQGPGKNFNLMYTLPQGAEVKVLAEVTTDDKENPVWYQIEYQGTGYVSKNYITLSADGKTGTVTTSDVGAAGNLRVHETEELTSETTIGRVSKDNTVTVLEETEEAYKVEYKETGYVASTYLTVTAKTVSLTGWVTVHNAPWGWVKDTLPAGKTVTVLEQTGDWYKVSYGEKTGYIYRLYIK